MLKTIYLVRHGHFLVPNPRPEAHKTKDMKLTVRGVEDVINLGNKIKEMGKRIEIIYSSPYERALQTSKILARFFHCPIKIESRLIEYTLGYRNEHLLETAYKEFTECVDRALDSNLVSMIVSHRLPISVFVSREKGVTYQEMLNDKKYIDMLKMGRCIQAVFSNRKLISSETI